MQLLGDALLSLQSWFQNVTYRHLALSPSPLTTRVSVVMERLQPEDPVLSTFLG